MGLRKKISDTLFFIPFGRYSQGEDAPPPYDQVLIGRESMRESFVSALFRLGRRGTFLITGRRGMGKTSFVRYCLHRYSDNVYGRFLRGDRGKNIPDMLTYVALMCVMAFSALLLIDLVTMAANPRPVDASFLTEKEKLDEFRAMSGSNTHWLLLVFLLSFTLFPLAYLLALSRRTIRVLSKDRMPLKLALSLLLIGTLAVSTANNITLPNETYKTIIYKANQGVEIKEDDFFKKNNWIRPSRVMTFISHVKIHSNSSPISLMSACLILSGIAILTLTLTGIGYDNRIGRYRRMVAIGTAIMSTVFFAVRYWLKDLSGYSFALPMAFFLHCLATCSLAVLLGRYALEKDEDRSLDVPSPGTITFILCICLMLGEASCVALADKFTKLFQVLIYNASFGALGYIALSYLTRNHNPKAQGLLRPAALHALNKRPADFAFYFRPCLLLLTKALVLCILLPQLFAPALVAFLQWRGQILDHSMLFVRAMDQTSLQWGFGLASLLLAFSVFEFGWVLRDRQLLRDQRKLSGDSVRGKGATTASTTTVDCNVVRREREWQAWAYGFSLERTTLPWHFLSQWFPSIVVEVNLGLNRLNHTDVIRSMLIGVRQRYHARFLSWNAPAHLISTGFFLLALLVAAESIGTVWLEWRPDSPKDICQSTSEIPTEDISSSDPNYTRIQLCRKLPTIHDLLYTPLLNLTNVRQDTALALLVFHTKTPPLASSCNNAWPNSQMYGVRVYHAVLLVIVLVVGLLLRRRWQVLPYRSHLRRIDDMLLSLSGNVRSKSERKFDPNIQRYLSGFSATESREVEVPRTDGRSIELRFLSLIEDLQRDSISLARNATLGFSIPAPEFTFVFDELDKLGENRNSDSPAPAQDGNGVGNTPDQELRRSQDVLKLLADMKRILSAGQCRFIFVGGRLLYDEWLADGVARVPLLSSIFDTQIYLPSLLVDNPFGAFIGEDENAPEIETRTQEFLVVQTARSRYMFRHWLGMTSLPVFGHPQRGRLFESFIAREQLSLISKKNRAEALNEWLKPLKMFDPSSEEITEIVDGRANRLREDFTRYLTYRSAGNPKRLRDLLGTFVRRRDQAHIFTKKSPEDYDFMHVLRFSDMELCRIQFCADVFSCLSTSFRSAMLVRDDKIAESIFFFSDFLFKFHRRAFSVANLERIDELEHVHRAPDVRDVFRGVVDEFSQRYLHSVLNGMYDYRFRSGIAKEIDYLSRVSAIDMAAFNFTLNESQTLKEIYQEAIQNPDKNIDIVAGLAEVLDHEQEYNKARQYYRQAIALIDASAESWMSVSAKDALRPGTSNDAIDLRWAIIRLRLMLQIGMTFEQAGNFERAEVQYHSAYVLAWNLIRSFVAAGSGQKTAAAAADAAEQPEVAPHFLHVLKHLNLVYQPAFAIAWVAEKQMLDVDSSAPFIEQELHALRMAVPALRQFPFSLPSRPDKVPGSNFRLVAAELHGKAGDLYFLKGRQFTPPAKIAEASEKDSISWTGYQIRAYFHYAVSLHEIRNYNWYRTMSSSVKYGVMGKRTFNDGNGPFFVHLAAANSLTNIAATLFARVSLFGVMKEVETERYQIRCQPTQSFAQAQKDILAPIDRWLFLANVGEKSGTETARDEKLVLSLGHGLQMDMGELHEWFGRWAHVMPPKERCTQCTTGHKRKACEAEKTCANSDHTQPITLEAPNSMAQRLLFSLHMLMNAATYAEMANCHEQAAEKMMLVARGVSTVLWWLASIRDLEHDWSQFGLPAKAADVDMAQSPFWSYLFNLGLEALSEARRLYAARTPLHTQQNSLHEMPAVITQACSFALLAHQWTLPTQLQASLKDLVATCCSGIGDGKVSSAEEIRGVLRTLIGFFRYPVLNRLHALKLICDSLSLDGMECGNEFEELRKLNSRYEAPLHFLPLDIGHTAARIWLGANMGDKKKLEDIRRLARQELEKSRGMYTLGSSYYATISGLHYLYDDFNDQEIIFGHAVQMAGAELTALLLDSLGPM